MSSEAETERASAGRVKALEGAVLGVVGAPAAGFGAAWSGIGDGRLHTWLFALILGGILGALSWPVFADAAGPQGRRGVGTCALFGFAVGLLAATVVAYPFGAVTGSLGGALGAAVAALVWRARTPFGPALAAASAASGAVVALGATAWWLA